MSEHGHTRRGNMKAEIREMCLQAKEHQKLPENQKEGKQPGTDSPSQPADGANPADTLTLDVQLLQL